MQSRNNNAHWCQLFSILAIATQQGCVRSEAPDIRSVAADLTVPEMVDGEPEPGLRVRQKLPGFEQTDVCHSVYLPEDYDATKKHPVIFEFAGNGGYRSPYGDECIGRPEGCKLGYGISGGKQFIWVCLPFVTENNRQIATKWWGDSPTFDPQPTIDYCKKAVPWICEKNGGDPHQVFLAGFSRGAIACNFIGLHDDEIAKLWCGFIAYSHYDGVFKWNYPGCDKASARVRLLRLNDRPQFVCHESTSDSNQGLHATLKYLKTTNVSSDFTTMETGFRNHNDAWVLRPSDARDSLRKWVAQVLTREVVQRRDIDHL